MVNVNVQDAEMLRRVVKATWIFVVSAGLAITRKSRISTAARDERVISNLDWIAEDAANVAEAVASTLEGDAQTP